MHIYIHIYIYIYIYIYILHTYIIGEPDGSGGTNLSYFMDSELYSASPNWLAQLHIKEDLYDVSGFYICICFYLCICVYLYKYIYIYKTGDEKYSCLGIKYLKN
jgi:ABC-type Fe3+-siderophore transport system permease subunit